MGRKEMKICKCGRIHLINDNVLTTALEQNKNIMLICAGCGKATIIGADIEPDMFEKNKKTYAMYSYDVSKNTEISINKFNKSSRNDEKPLYKILYNEGYKVPMMTGNYASDYFDGHFSDRWYPDFYHIERKDITTDEIFTFINKWKKDRSTVNMQRFINETPAEVLDVISCYYITGFNWDGTIYKKY